MKSISEIYHGVDYELRIKARILFYMILAPMGIVAAYEIVQAFTLFTIADLPLCFLVAVLGAAAALLRKGRYDASFFIASARSFRWSSWRNCWRDTRAATP